MLPIEWLRGRLGRPLAVALAACCLLAADAKEGEKNEPRPLEVGDTVSTRAGAELMIDGEVIATLDECVELKILKMEGDLLHCRIVSGNGTAHGEVRKSDVTQHPLALVRKPGVFQFVLCRVAPKEKDAIAEREKTAVGDAQETLARELALILKAQRRAILPAGLGGKELALTIKRLSEAGAAAAEQAKVVKEYQNKLFSTYVLFGAYRQGEISHDAILAAMTAEADKLAEQHGWDAEALRRGLAAAVEALDTAVGGSLTHVAGRFRDKPAR